MSNRPSDHRIVILGGGFGGLYAAKSLASAQVRVTLVDKRNFHLFQPLLYQVASGGLSPGDISSPLRGILKKKKNIQVLQAEALDIDPDNRQVTLNTGALSYDTLIVASGMQNFYFGNGQWAPFAPGLKSVEDALLIRSRILQAFEAAENESDPDEQSALLRFVIVGGGPTGVELAGALGELARFTMKEDFRKINPSKAQIILLEGSERLLGAYPAELAHKAEMKLHELGVEVRKSSFVTGIDDRQVVVQHGKHGQTISARTIVWAAGVISSSLGNILASRTDVQRDGLGRLIVQPNLTIPNYPNILVIGDLAHFQHNLDAPLPGVAPVAIQEGRYAAKVIRDRLKGKDTKPFRYQNKGNLAVIGRNAAIADFGFLRISGILAWLLWVFVHITYLIEFDNRILVLIQWAINYFTRKRGARLITWQQQDPASHVEQKRLSE